MAKEQMQEWMKAQGVTVEAVFVPYSQSRSAKADSEFKGPNLNWSVTIKRNGNPILTTDYSAGVGHCQSKLPEKFSGSAGWKKNRLDDLQRAECETGFAHSLWPWADETQIRPERSRPTMPDPCDVLHCLATDASVLDEGGFENWASSVGYDTDSRKAERIYRECLEQALKLRWGLGEAGLRALQEAAEDY